MLTEAEILATYHQTIRPLYAYVARRVGGDVGLAEDLVQDTWLRALDAWPARGVPDEPLAWLTRVAHNALVSHFRRSRPISIDPAIIDLEHPAPNDAHQDGATMVGWGLTRLGRADAALLEAFYFDGQSTRDIAREHALPERAVEGRLRRARAKLKKTLQRLWKRPSAQRRAAARGTEDAQHT
jgi:RNA polymerase sigma factor (sigma-70 family)